MSKVNRNAPKRSRASQSRYSLFEFDKEFPDDTACLEAIFRTRYPGGTAFCPKCQRDRKFHREKKRPSYICGFCGTRIHPMVGTIFENSATSLRLWFYAMYLMASTRCGISAKQMERELGVTYKTAWRMFNRIRSLLSQDDIPPMGGTVEVDETYIGGRRHYGDRQTAARSWSQHKQVVAGHVQRDGKLRAMHLPQGTAQALVPLVQKYVLPASSSTRTNCPPTRRWARWDTSIAAFTMRPRSSWMGMCIQALSTASGCC